MSPFIHLTWNYVAVFFTARTKSRQILFDFQPVTMEIHEPKVTPKLQKKQNLGKFLIFDVFLQLWIFTLTTNIWDVNSHLSYATIHIIGKHFWASQDHRWPQSLKVSVTNFVIFRKILQKTLNFNCDFLKEGKRYSTFPVDILKAETIVFHQCCNENPSISLLLGVKSLQKNEGHWN
jgi:hypothetical protein